MQPTLFAVFNEIGIIAQLSRALFEARLPAGINVPQFSVLNHLIRVRDGQTPLDLARAFQVPKTSMTHTLSGLERHGLVRIDPNPDDGRSKCVWLTGAGRAFRDDAITALQGDMAGLRANIDIDALTALLPTLITLRKALDHQRDPA